MAQNNYIEYIRNSAILNDLPSQPSLLNCSIYTNLVGYSLQPVNTKNAYSKLIAPNTQRVFDMDLSFNNCEVFELCNNTNLRVNRKLQFTQLPIPVSNYIRDADTCSCINALNLVRDHKLNKEK